MNFWEPTPVVLSLHNNKQRKTKLSQARLSLLLTFLAPPSPLPLGALPLVCLASL